MWEDTLGGAGGYHVTDGKSIHYLVGKPDDIRQSAERVDGRNGLPQTGIETRSRTLWTAVVLWCKRDHWRDLASTATHCRFRNIRELRMSDGIFFFSFGENRR